MPGKSKPKTAANKNGDEAGEKEDGNAASIFGAVIFAVVAITIAATIRPIMYTNQSELQRRLATEADPIKPAFVCDEEALSSFLHENPVQGMHVLCLGQKKNNFKSLHLDAYVGSQEGKKVSLDANGKDEEEVTLDQIKASMEKLLGLRQRKNRQSWAIFNPVGERIVGKEDTGFNNHFFSRDVMNDLVESGMFLLFEGGQWLWPGVREGFRRTIDLFPITPGLDEQFQENRTAILKTLSLQPLVLSVEGFLSPEECDHIQVTADPRMSYSGVVLMDKDKDRPASDFRTSQSTFLASKGDDVLTDIEYRTSSLVRIPRNHQEHVQVLRYGYGEKYNAHHDWFNPIYYQNDPRTLANIENGKRNRLATVFWYLTDVERGGETNFPRHNGLPQPRDLARCEQGLKVKPQRGKVIIFYSLAADGTGDELSLHAACPVEEGIKWAANKWVWNSPRDFIRD